MDADTMTQTIIDMLDEESVSIRTLTYIQLGDMQHLLTTHRVAYVNSEHGRATIATELPDPYLSAVLMIWGDSPTVIESEG